MISELYYGVRMVLEGVLLAGIKCRTGRIPFFDVDSSILPFLAEESGMLAGWELYER